MFGPRADMGTAPCEVQESLSKGGNTCRMPPQWRRPVKTTSGFFAQARSCAYEGWTVAELKKRAKQLGISGYSGLSKENLIALIRSY